MLVLRGCDGFWLFLGLRHFAHAPVFEKDAAEFFAASGVLRFDVIGTGPAKKGFGNVFLSGGSGENYGGNDRPSGVCLHVLQDGKSVHAGHLQIEKHKGRERKLLSIRKFGVAFQVGHRFGPAVDGVCRKLRSDLVEGARQKKSVVLVIIDDQNDAGCVVH